MGYYGVMNRRSFIIGTASAALGGSFTVSRVCLQPRDKLDQLIPYVDAFEVKKREYG